MCIKTARFWEKKRETGRKGKKFVKMFTNNGGIPKVLLHFY